jgi:hypothetical protein
MVPPERIIALPDTQRVPRLDYLAAIVAAERPVQNPYGPTADAVGPVLARLRDEAGQAGQYLGGVFTAEQSGAPLHVDAHTHATRLFQRYYRLRCEGGDAWLRAHDADSNGPGPTTRSRVQRQRR